MKRFTKIIAASLLALCLITPAAACQKKEESNNNSGSSAAAQAKSVVGKWTAKIDEAMIDELYASYPEEAREQGKQLAKTAEMHIEFKEDGTYTATASMAGMTMPETSAKYTVNGTTVQIEEGSAEESGNTSTLHAATFILGDDDVLRPTGDAPEMSYYYFVRE